MSQAVVDPVELRRFALNLDRFSNELESQMMTIRGQLNNLSQTWRDQEQKIHVRIRTNVVGHQPLPRGGPAARAFPDAQGRTDRRLLASALSAPKGRDGVVY